MPCLWSLSFSRCVNTWLWFLFVCVATELVTVYVFQEPSMLSPLQANGLTDVVLQALLVKDVSQLNKAFDIL